MFYFYTSLAAISSFPNIDGPLSFCCMISFLNGVDIQLILKLKISFGNIIQYDLKILKGRFLGHPVIFV